MSRPTKQLSQRVKQAARSVGLEVGRFRPTNIGSRRQRILEHNAISLVVDVGANEGQYGRRLRDEGYQGRIISFEPLADAFDVLRGTTAPDPNWDAKKLALSDSRGHRRLNISEMSTGS